ncbi:hypothetical protein BDR03DRAFT_968611 [Suillus americanus]|nr:hypothetical protein BDR03DRAFT_968611 [Suillus americanus]
MMVVPCCDSGQRLNIDDCVETLTMSRTPGPVYSSEVTCPNLESTSTHLSGSRASSLQKSPPRHSQPLPGTTTWWTRTKLLIKYVLSAFLYISFSSYTSYLVKGFLLPLVTSPAE